MDWQSISRPDAFSTTSSHNNPLDELVLLSPSLLDLIQMKLSQGSVSTAAGPSNSETSNFMVKTKSQDATMSGTNKKLKASNFPASLFKIGRWEHFSADLFYDDSTNQDMKCNWLEGLFSSERPTLNQGSTRCGKHQLILLIVRLAYRGKSSFLLLISSALGSKLLESTSLFINYNLDKNDNWVLQCHFSAILQCHSALAFNKSSLVDELNVYGHDYSAKDESKYFYPCK
ncbi:unnamed protein product [Citrullus colocynthis]|uniref:Uncharacterized protein n=1 Tax=Citrullus colocynthis TaxID=252529 RepID=A0ABP0YU31_9ROSI